MHDYVVTLIRTVIQTGSLIVRADSPEDAERRADLLVNDPLDPVDPDNWSEGSVEGEIQIDVAELCIHQPGLDPTPPEALNEG